MTNGDKMRKMGDDELTRNIIINYKDNKRCKLCTVGLDEKNRCKNPEAECDVEIYKWLGQQI